MKKQKKGLGRRTVKITLAGYGETPAGVFRESVEHVVEEADARVDVDGLALAGLFGVVVASGEEARVGCGGEGASVEVEGQLDLGLVGVAGDGGPPGG